MAKGRKLTKKQTIFVKEYLVDLNATQAAIRAGYSEKTAQEQSSRLLSNVMVQDAIQKGMAEREAQTGITARYVLNSLRTVAERCMEAEPVLDREGNETGQYKFNASGANRALELLGKHLGMFEKQTDDLSRVAAILEHMASIAGTVQNPQPQRHIEDFEAES